MKGPGDPEVIYQVAAGRERIHQAPRLTSARRTRPPRHGMPAALRETGEALSRAGSARGQAGSRHDGDQADFPPVNRPHRPSDGEPRTVGATNVTRLYPSAGPSRQSSGCVLLGAQPETVHLLSASAAM